MSTPRVAYIALGSNIGDREGHLRQAIERLRGLDGCDVTAQAEPRHYAAVGGPPGQAEYLNSAVAVTTGLNPFALLRALQSIEESMGRPAADDRPRNADRTIDLDLLLYDRTILATQALIVPHPRMHRRRFVLEPLASIAAEAVHPVYGRTAAQLLERWRA